MNVSVLEAVCFLCAGASACMCGAFAATAFAQWRKRVRTRRHLRECAGVVEGSGFSTACGGLGGALIGFAVRTQTEMRYQATFSLASTLHLEHLGEARFAEKARLAGLDRHLLCAGYNESRVRLAVLGSCAGALLGTVFSNELAAILMAAGGVAGFGSVGWAVKQELSARRAALEHELPEMLEVVALGLRSGLTFDRSFRLYHTHFSTSFSRECAHAQQTWDLGLSARSDALRGISDRYDSQLLSRVMDATIRSLRFGSSLAETLEASASEARAAYKTHREEKVAKAPVKMMVPIGTLILPAMLLLVLGPVLLELMEGF